MYCWNPKLSFPISMLFSFRLVFVFFFRQLLGKVKLEHTWIMNKVSWIQEKNMSVKSNRTVNSVNGNFCWDIVVSDRKNCFKKFRFAKIKNFQLILMSNINHFKYFLKAYELSYFRMDVFISIISDIVKILKKFSTFEKQNNSKSSLLAII